jgi:hypothetical protein
MKVILPLGDVRCGACGSVLHQEPAFPKQYAGRYFFGSCYTVHCQNGGRKAVLTAKMIDVPEIPA